MTAPAVTIGVLAEALKKLMNSDVPVKVIGMRHGEKMYEAVLAGLLILSPAREALVAKGDERLKKFPDAAAKNGRLCDLIESFARDHVR